MKKYSIGEFATISKIFNEEDVYLFSKLSGDKNPVHLDQEYAEKSIFKNRIVHGFLYSSLISAVIANQLPGNGSIYKNQDLKFIRPVYFGEKVTAKVKIIDVINQKNIIILETICFKNEDEDEVVVEGKAVIKVV